MANNVLILDDDVDFNSLLTDIFEQADYIVTSAEDPVEAVELFRSTDYDLVVTDHRMPNMTGTEFMRAIKLLKSEVPVIMVSGYLENDTIRELISEGVGGVFLKPLNIFSLLERTGELIEQSQKKSEVAETTDEVDAAAHVTKLGFTFRSFPCKSDASIQFAEKLYGLRNFKSTLSLIGQPGARYQAICEDIRVFYENDAEHFVYFSPSSFDEDQAVTALESAKASGAERVTVVLLQLESMTGDQKDLAIVLSKGQGRFSDLDLDLRTIFCVSGDLDSLFDEGLINENLYILMGTAEVQVPALSDCTNDIAVLAQQIVVSIAREKKLSSVPRLEKPARDLLQQQSWDGDFEALSGTVRRLTESNSGDVLTAASLSAILQTTVAATPRARFDAYLSGQQVDLVRAALIFMNGDRSKAAKFYGTDVNALERVLR